MASRLQDVILRGTSGTRPAANTVAPGTLYYSTDTATTDRSNGTIWETYADTSGGGSSVTVSRLSVPFVVEPEELAYELFVPGQQGQQGLRGPAGVSVPYVAEQEELIYEPPIPIVGPTGPAGPISSGGITQLTGDVTAGPGSGSQAATIVNDVVTYAKIQNISATDRLLGRDTAGAGDTEEIPVTSGIEFTGGPGLRVTAAARTKSIGITIDGGGSAITTGIKGDVSVPVAGTITAVRMLADQSGSIVVDIWKDTYANYPPTVADTITASAKPTISTTTKSEDTTLTGWTTSVAAGDTMRFNVDSATTITRVTLQLTFVVT